MSDERGNFTRNFYAPSLVITLQDSPRFGHSTDITSLMGSSDEAADYTAGLIAACFLTILCFFIVFLSLPILMCLGQKRVGFLSGAPLKARSERSSSATNQIDENFNEMSANDVLQKPETNTEVDAMQRHEEPNDYMDSTEICAVNVSQKLDEAQSKTDSIDVPQRAQESSSFVDTTQGLEVPDKNIDSIYTLQKPEKNVTRCNKCRNCCLDPSHIWVRGTFILSGIIFIVFSILLGTQGVLNLQKTIDSVNSLATDIDELALDAEDILRSSLLRLQTQATSIRDLLVTELSDGNFCPADPSLQNSTIFAEIRDKADNATAALSQLNDFLGDQVESLSDAINDAAKGAREVQSATEDVNISGGLLAILMIPYTIVPFMLIVAAVLAHFDKSVPILNSANRWFFMPFFLILVIIAAGTASGMIAAASANSDFCLPGGQPTDNYSGTSPDTTVLRVLDRKGHSADLERKIADFYVDQCQNKPDPFLFLRGYVPKVMDGRAQLDEFLQSLQSSDTLMQLSAYCNRSYDSLDELIIEMAGLLDIKLDAIRGVLGLISCSRIVPIYHSAFYDSSCAYSVSAVFWVFSSALIMGTFGVVMLLFRAACKPTLYEVSLTDPDTADNEHVMYDEELKDPNERDTFEDRDVGDEAEMQDGKNEFTSVAKVEADELLGNSTYCEEANGYVIEDTAIGIKRL